MKGVMIPCVSAGSNQVGASDTWMPQVSCPSGPAAPADPGVPATSPRAARTRTSRRVTLLPIDGPRLSRSTVRLPCCLRGFDRDVFEGSRVREVGDQAEPRFADPRADAVEKTQLPDRCVNHPLREDLLHLVEDRRAFLALELGCLLLVER